MTPALPGEAPDPSATPRLDARLREVETLEARERHLWDVFDNKAFPFRQSDAARLAAIVRVLVEAVTQAASFGEGPVVGPEFDCPYHAMEARAALARAEALAKGEPEAPPPPVPPDPA